MTEQVTLTVGGTVYSGWTKIEVERGITKCATHLAIEVSERWTGQDEPWRILPFGACTLAIGGDTVLTGHIDEYNPSYTEISHKVAIVGRSKTADLVDCTPDIPSGQFTGYTVAAIARSIAGLFGIGVVVQTDQANVVVANTQLQRCETAFSFLERLGRLSGVLLCDDEQGNLVLATAGSQQAAGALIIGQNIKRGSAKISGAKRHSDWIVKGQSGLGVAGGDSYAGAGGTGNAPAGSVQTQLRAVAQDPGVPRYRPRVVLAESQLTQAGMQLRANWLRTYSIGQATKATYTVQGYRQPDGSLWKVNQIVPVQDDWLDINDDLLIVRVKFGVDERLGQVTELDVGPVAGYTPDPGEVRLRKSKGKGGHGIDWSGAGGGGAP
jgi:prophage tail gpP-like protein